MASPRAPRAAVLLCLMWVASVAGIGVLCTAASDNDVPVAVTTPARPLLGVTFLATTSVGPDRTLYIASDSGCGNPVSHTCTVGHSVPGVNFNSTTCSFTVTAANMSINVLETTVPIPPLYWCSSATGTTSFAVLQMNRVRVSPAYAFAGSSPTFTFNQATPVGTRVGLYNSVQCETLVPGESSFTLSESRQIAYNIDAPNTFVCAAIPNLDGVLGAVTAWAVLYSVSPYQINTGQLPVVRHRPVTLAGNGMAVYVSLSTDPMCETLAEPYRPGNAMPMTFNVSRGSYYYCSVIIPGAASTVGVFVPATNKLTVLEYALQPQTMYAATATKMFFALDAEASPSTLQVALYDTVGCNGTRLVDWGRDLSWTLTTTGTYYACMRDPNGGPALSAPAYVNKVVVSNIPAVKLSRLPVIGLGEVATVTRNSSDTVASAVVRVGLSVAANCATLFTSGDTTVTGSTASFYVPEGTNANIYSCVSNRLTTDASDGDSSQRTAAVYYPLEQLVLRTYDLSYPPLRTQTTMAVTLDGQVSFDGETTMCLTPELAPSGGGGAPSNSATCDDALAASKDVSMIFPISSHTTTLSPVSFPLAGSWLLCVREQGVLGGAYVRLRRLPVYANATVAPRGIVAGVPATLAITAVPGVTTVTLTTDGGCSPTMTSVATAQSTVDGAASLPVTYNAVGRLFLCVGYRGEQNGEVGPAVTLLAGEVGSSAVHAMPSVAVGGVLTRLTFATDGASTLNTYVVVLTPSSTPGGAPPAQCSTTGAGVLQFPISTASTSGGIPIAFVQFTPGSSTAGTTYRVCVGTGDVFQPAGTLAVVAAPPLRTDPSPLASGLPSFMTFNTTFLSLLSADAFAVIAIGGGCTTDLNDTTTYTAGTINRGTGAAQGFIAPPTATGVKSARVCVAQSAQLVGGTLGYADAGTVAFTTFTAVTRYAQRERPNTLVGAPLATSAELSLTPCHSATECAADNADAACGSPTAPQYTTSSTTPLEAPAGTYLLCQRTSILPAVVGADATVTVMDPYKLTLSTNASLLRVYVPFDVTVSGGPPADSFARVDAAHTLVIKSASSSCSDSSGQSQTFTVGSGTTQITITDITPTQRIRFCMRPSPADSFQVLTGTLLPYTAPAAVVGDRATTLTSGGGAALPDGTRAMLSRTASCADDVVGGGAAAVVGGRVTFTVAACGANAALTSLHYCEAVGGGAFASRGVVALLRSQGCSGGAGASIRDVTVAPAAAITDFGIDAAYLERPRLSASADCGVLLDAAVASVGYAPGVGERAAFHVCAVLVGDASVPFTTALPTLRVTNWAVQPTAALSRYSASRGAASPATMTLDPAAPSRETFFSAAGDCSARVGGAAGMGGASRSAVYNTTGVRGLVSVCTVAPLGGATLAVAQFLSVTPPAVLRASPAVVRGGDYAATLVVDGVPPLYSMVAGEDAAYEHSALYTSPRREVYLSSNACAAVLAGTTAAAVAPSGAVALATGGIDAGVRAVWLCAWTAAGQAVVLADVAVAPGSVYPTQYVSGARGAAVYMPGHALATVRVSASASGCGSVAGMPQFTIDAEGYGALDVWSDAGDALALGAYTLCVAAAGGGGLAPVAAVEVVAPAYFDVRGTTFIVGVPGAMALLQDLRADALEPGFSTARDCSAVSSEHGAWAAVSSTSVSVHATSVYTAGLYLCARAPVNGTLVSVPGSWGGRSRQLEFVTSPVQLPSAGWDTCTAYALDQCQPPGASAGSATAVLVVVQGDCCSAESRDRVVGRASMASGTCELTLDGERVRAYPAGAAYHVCVWDSADDAVCTTLGETRVGADCTAAGGGGGGLSRGATAGVVVGCIGGVACAAAGAAVWVRCCRRRSLRAAAGDGDGGDGDDDSGAAAAAAAAGGGGAARVRWLPELWRRRGVAEERAAGDGGAAVAPAAPETRWVKNPLLLATAYESGAVLVPDDLPAVPVTVEDRLRCLPKQEWQGRRRVAAREGEARRLVELRRGAAGRAVCLRVDMDFDAGRYRVGPDGVLRHRSESPLSDE